MSETLAPRSGRHRWVVLGLGIVCAVAGALLLTRPFASLAVLVLLVGFGSIVSGLSELVERSESQDQRLATAAGLGWILLGLAILMHDGAHGCLSADEKVNLALSQWFCAYPIFAETRAYRRYHLQHHARTQQEDDPDLVLSAQSFHWFGAGPTLIECRRILKPRGRLAIMWNRRSRTDPLTEGYRQAIAEVGGESSIERMAFDPDVVARSGLFSPVERMVFPNHQRLDLDGLIGRARSASYCPKDGPAAGRLRALLGELWQRYADRDGLVSLVYETELYRSLV